MLEDLKKGVNLRSRSSFNEILLIKDKEDIASKLKNLGYYFAEIDTSVEELSDNKVNLVFNISITFFLNEAFSTTITKVS